MISLADEENKFYEKQKVYYICKKEFCTDEFNSDENDQNEFNIDENGKMNLILMKMIKMNLILMKTLNMHFDNTIKSEIIVITLENLEELPIIFVI